MTNKQSANILIPVSSGLIITRAAQSLFKGFDNRVYYIYMQKKKSFSIFILFFLNQIALSGVCGSLFIHPKRKSLYKYMYNLKFNLFLLARVNTRKREREIYNLINKNNMTKNNYTRGESKKAFKY
jgi:hypothetical protein